MATQPFYPQFPKFDPQELIIKKLREEPLTSHEKLRHGFFFKYSSSYRSHYQSRIHILSDKHKVIDATTGKIVSFVKENGTRLMCLIGIRVKQMISKLNPERTIFFKWVPFPLIVIKDGEWGLVEIQGVGTVTENYTVNMGDIGSYQDERTVTCGKKKWVIKQDSVNYYFAFRRPQESTERSAALPSPIAIPVHSENESSRALSPTLFS